MLDVEERFRVTQALDIWLERHPSPDDPAVHIALSYSTADSVSAYSARDIVRSVADDTELGRRILEILEYSIRRSSLDAVARDLETFDGEPPPRPRSRT